MQELNPQVNAFSYPAENLIEIPKGMCDFLSASSGELSFVIGPLSLS